MGYRAGIKHTQTHLADIDRKKVTLYLAINTTSDDTSALSSSQNNLRNTQTGLFNKLKYATRIKICRERSAPSNKQKHGNTLLQMKERKREKEGRREGRKEGNTAERGESI